MADFDYKTDSLDSEKIRGLIIEHSARYPMMQITDYFKLLYHSAFGCEHAVSSLEGATEYLLSEIGRADMDSHILVESLCFGYSRVHLDYLSKGLLPKTLAKLFFLSAGRERKGIDLMLCGIEILKDMARSGEINISLTELDAALSRWQSLGYPAVHHSEIYRQNYNPAYRVICDRYVALLPTFTDIDKAIIDGRKIDLRDVGDDVYQILAEVYEDIIPKR